MTPLARRLRTAMLKIDGIIESPGIFGDGDAFWVNGKQIGNWRSDREIELRLTRPVIREHRQRLKDEPGVTLRSSSDWVTLALESARDVSFAIELAELAAAAHRPAAGVPAKPPPLGADLERRRRFH